MKQNISEFIKNQLNLLKNKQNAEAMARYMKTDMPFYGVKAAERRQVAQEAIKKFPISNQAEYNNVITHLWSQPTREEKYIAIDVARLYPNYITLNAVPLYKTMIQEGAWWDFVDDIAAHLVGTVLKKELKLMWSILEAWNTDEHMWLRRTTIIAQLKHKDATDEQRLFTFCLQRAHEKEFFIRKAIGWALREYAKTAPKNVYAFVAQHKDTLSPLSCREAFKHKKLK